MGISHSYVGVISRDATLINVGNSTFLAKRNLFNFEKCVILWTKLAREILCLQRSPFAFAIIPSLRATLQTLPQPDEHELYQLSIKLEPIGANS